MELDYYQHIRMECSKDAPNLQNFVWRKISCFLPSQYGVGSSWSLGHRVEVVTPFREVFSIIKGEESCRVVKLLQQAETNLRGL